MWDGEGVVVRIGDIAIIVEVSGQSGGFNENELRLVSSPVRTVTRREIVPGGYGIVSVGRTAASFKKVPVGIEYLFYGAAELREAAHLFTQIAEVLEEQAAGEQQKEAA